MCTTAVPSGSRRLFSATIGFAAAGWLTAIVSLGAAFPEPRGYVSDFANVIDEQTEQELTTLLRDLEKEPSAEVAVATVTSLEGLTVDDYAVQLYQQWGVGQAIPNNGVLVLVVSSIRIEVGYGLEDVLPDGLDGEIVRTLLVFGVICYNFFITFH